MIEEHRKKYVETIRNRVFEKVAGTVSGIFKG